MSEELKREVIRLKDAMNKLDWRGADALELIAIGMAIEGERRDAAEARKTGGAA